MTNDFYIGDTITLIGKSQKGKNRIRENGGEWIVLQSSRGLPDCKDTLLLVEPLTQKDPQRPYVRWVDIFNDPHFEIKEKTDHVYV